MKSDTVRSLGDEWVAAYDYALPDELIAQEPAQPRDASRLMVIHRASGHIEHRHFRDLPEYLSTGDALVLNDTRVLPARLVGQKQTGGSVEILLLKRLGNGLWEALAKPSRRLPPGTELSFGPRLRVLMHEYGTEGTRVVELIPDGDEVEVLHQVGEIPLPPYIQRKLADPERYQTVYARAEGSAAAPTAGLHFTESLFQRLETIAIATHYVTLHVGVGTFRPVMTERVADHVMHREWYEVSNATATAVNATKAAGNKVIAVGTTSCRTLESATTSEGVLEAGASETDLFIHPGYKFKMIDALITNFHLPRSSLLMLVAAFAGKELMDRAYQEAVAQRYRFYSLGDAMLIL